MECKAFHLELFFFTVYHIYSNKRPGGTAIHTAIFGGILSAFSRKKWEGRLFERGRLLE